MLQKNGLKRNDYTLVPIGGTLQRYQDLLELKHAATLLNTPFDLFAADKGFNILGSAGPILGHYHAAVGATRRAWAKEHHRELVGFIRAQVAASEWLRNPAHKSEAIALAIKNTPNLSPALAERIYDRMRDPKNGVFPKLTIDMQGVKTVLSLRSEYGEPKKKLTDPAKYIDLSYYKEAMKSAQR
jgi:ABC-type nitrate/sulfonate/bicarbonate transport system substrate-binding protein